MALPTFQPGRSTHPNSRAAVCLFAGVAFGALALPARARAEVYVVSLDTSQLTPGHQYAADFQLNGDGTGSSVISLSSFSFGTGRAGKVDDSTGAMGDASQGVTLAETATYSYPEFTQEFSNGGNAGSMVNFTVDTSQLNAAAMDRPPDTFAFALLDTTPADGPTTVATNNPDDGYSLLTVVNNGNGDTVTPYSYTGTDGNTYAPQVTTMDAGSAAPEPASWTVTCLIGLGLGVLWLRARRRDTVATE